MAALTAMTDPRFTTSRWPGCASSQPGKSNTRRSGCSSVFTSARTSLVNMISTSTLPAGSATNMVVTDGRELRDVSPASSWTTAGVAPKPAKRRINVAAESIRIAAVNSVPFYCAISASGLGPSSPGSFPSAILGSWRWTRSLRRQTTTLRACIGPWSKRSHCPFLCFRIHPL